MKNTLMYKGIYEGISKVTNPMMKKSLLYLV